MPVAEFACVMRALLSPPATEGGSIKASAHRLPLNHSMRVLQAAAASLWHRQLRHSQAEPHLAVCTGRVSAGAAKSTPALASARRDAPA